ncbi:MAG: selenium-dependent molybdenum cofactor biosynthesis protein YqeB [Negativicutes bacterium]|nr:selenium-dependent molybdenum cofactor biosynthesis protein YqeB [Negativicutes bacterium]
MDRLVVIKGAGDMASGIAHRLHRSGYKVIMTEIAQPTAIRRTVAFAEAIFAGEAVVEGLTAFRAKPEDAMRVVGEGRIAVTVDPVGRCVKLLRPWAVVDAILAKRNTGTSMNDAPVVIGVGPGFVAGQDVHLVVETMRGHYLGKVIEQGPALPNTGVPGEIAGHTVDRILRAPCQGLFSAAQAIADVVAAGSVVARVDGQPVIAAISGVLRGLLHDGVLATPGMKVGDIDPRCVPEHCFTVSDKARSVAGGVLEGLLYWGRR